MTTYMYEGDPNPNTIYNSFAEILLLSLLDQKQMSHKDKQSFRNCAIPLIELIEQSETPEDVFDAMMKMIKFACLATSFGILKCCIPDKRDILKAGMDQAFNEELTGAMKMIEMWEKKAKEKGFVK